MRRNATSYRKRQMRNAREVVRLCAEARVVGVAFWDFKHGQTGVAPNAIELHPILGFACLSAEPLGHAMMSSVCQPVEP